MRLTVVGNGVGGRLCAKLVSGLPGVERVTVLEAAASYDHIDINQNQKKLGDFYTGLWSPSLKCLSKYLDGSSVTMKQLFQNGTLTPVGHSGYRTVTGQWLMTPSQPMNTDSSRLHLPTLAFIQSKDLLNLIDDHIVGRPEKIETCYGTIVEKVVPSSGRNNSSTRCDVIAVGNVNDMIQKTLHPSDLLIAADGAYSTVKKLLYPTSAALSHRGYTVYRGHCTSKFTEDAYQTWGRGTRFAVVATQAGHQWYLATNRLSKYNLETKPSDSLHAKHGPFVNQCIDVSPEEVSTIMRLLQDDGFHDPCYSLVAATDIEHIAKCDAIATNSINSDEFGGLLNYGSQASLPVVFLGDAACTLDPILAQGTGIAIEDACHLFEYLQYRLQPPVGGSGKALQTDELVSIINAFNKHRLPRRRNLYNLSNLAQMFGQVDNKFAVLMRDITLGSLLPDAIKSRTFDYFTNIGAATGSSQ